MNTSAETPKRVAAILVARSAIAAAPIAEMRALAVRVNGTRGIATAAFAFTEQGEPSLRETVLRLRDEGFAELLLLPILVPMEPGFPGWLGRALARWRDADAEGLPMIRLAPAPMATAALRDLLDEMVGAALSAPPLSLPARAVTEGSVVPAQRHRVLICMGGPCNNAGAAALWGHFRNEQERRALRTAGDGTMSAKTSCLGPCSLAPVIQVFPEGTYYGGVDEAGIDRIIEKHLLRGEVLHDLAYAPGRGKQRWRKAAASSPVIEIAEAPK